MYMHGAEEFLYSFVSDNERKLKQESNRGRNALLEGDDNSSE